MASPVATLGSQFLFHSVFNENSGGWCHSLVWLVYATIKDLRTMLFAVLLFSVHAVRRNSWCHKNQNAGFKKIFYAHKL